MSTAPTAAPSTVRPAYASTLPAGALAYRNLRDAVSIVVTAALAIVAVVLFVPQDIRATALVIVALVAVLAVLLELPLLNRAAVRRTSYEVSADAVRIRRGLLFGHDVTISAAQILTVTIVEGPVLRRFGFVAVRFVCIADIEALGPVTPAEAHRIRDVVLSLYLGGHDED